MPELSLSAATPDALVAFGLSATARAARLGRAAALLDGAGLDCSAAAVAAVAHRSGELDRWVATIGDAFLAADPSPPTVLSRSTDGDGQIVEVFGDLTTAQHVAILVPGLNTTLANEAFGLRASAAHLYSAASALDPSVAVVIWLGYDAPELATVLLSGRAETGGKALASFVADLAARPSATVTVVGHSYGSLVAADALRDGMQVDDLVVAGSPGLGADSADHLPLHGAELYALRAPFDPVSLLEPFGRDPSDPRFGATRLATGGGEDDPIGHSSYFEPGTTSLANIAAVVAGRADQLRVVSPSSVEQVVGRADDVFRNIVDRPMDEAQASVKRANGAADWVDDVVDGLLPGPLGDAARAERAARDAAVEVGDRAVDVIERVGSPDFFGDLAGDAWSLLG